MARTRSSRPLVVRDVVRRLSRAGHRWVVREPADHVRRTVAELQGADARVVVDDVGVVHLDSRTARP